MATTLSNDTSVLSTTDTKTTSKAEASMDTQNKGASTQEQGSVLTTMFEQMGKVGSIMAVGLIVLLIVGGILFFKYGGSFLPSPTSDGLSLRAMIGKR
jgi:hypothetical protein